MNVFLFSLLLLFAASPADAAIVGVAIAAVSGWLATATPLALFAARIVTSVVLSAVSRALQRQEKGPVRGITTEVTLTGGTNPDSFIIGRYATAGTFISPPLSHGTRLKYLTYIIDISMLPGCTLSRLFVNGEPVVIGAGTHADYGSEIEGEYQDLMWIRYHDGSQTVADAMLLDKYSADPDFPWSADMIGEGRCYAILTCKFHQKRLSSHPRYLFEMDGVPLYDPRKDSTIGGSGVHRWADWTTWEQTDNTAIMAYNFTRGVTFPDGSVWGGEATDLPLPSFAAAMNECDVAIPLAAGGTEPQFRAGYEVFVDQEPADVLEALMSGCSGDMVEVGGAWFIQVGAPPLPIYYFTDDDVVVSEPQQLDPWPGLAETINGVAITYPEPDAAWQSKDSPPLYRADLEATDRDRRLVADISLPSTPYPMQVQRIASAYVEDHRRFRKHTLTLPPDAAFLNPLNTVSWTSDRNGYSGKLFEIASKETGLRNLLSQVMVRERDPSDYDWSPSKELPTFFPPVKRTVPAPYVLGGVTVAATSIKDASGNSRRPAVLLSWTQIDNGGIEWQLRVKATGVASAQGFLSNGPAGSLVISEGILPDTTYELRAMAVIDGVTEWTVWLDVTTLDLRVDVADLTDLVWTDIAEDATDIASSLVTMFEIGTFDPTISIIEGTITAIDRTLELRDIEQRSAGDAIGKINDHLLWLLANVSRAESVIRDAGIYTDPVTGVVSIAAFSGLKTDVETRVSDVEIRVDAQDADILLRATMAQVNLAISNAVLDPTQIPLLDDLEVRVSNVEIDIDALSGAITLKADLTVVDAINVRLSTAEVTINSVEASITLKVDQTDFDALETRTSSAEIEIAAIDGAAIRQTVMDTRALQNAADIAGLTNLQALLDAYETRQAWAVDIAYATQDMRALVTENRSAMAAIETALGASISGNTALISTERTVRADADGALAEDIATLQVNTGGNSAAITELNKVEADSGSANARAVHQVQLDVTTAQGDATANATALSGLDTRVEATETGLTSQAQQLTVLDSRVGATETTNGGQATALTNLTTRVTTAEGDITSQGQDITSLTANVGGLAVTVSATATITSSLVTSVQALDTLTTAHSAAITSLSSTVGDHTTSIAQQLVTINGIQAEYALRIDNNGVVAGMVLRSEMNNVGVVASAAAFQVDKFAIIAPGDTPSTPFVAYSTPRVINGQTLPAGVYMENVFIGQAAIGRAQITDTIESDNYAEDADGTPTAGMKLNFATGSIKTAGIVTSRNLVINSGQFTYSGTLSNGSELLFVNSGIRMGKDDVWAVTNDTFIVVATITSGATGPGSLNGSEAFWGLSTRLVSGARWFGFPGTPPTPIQRKDPASLVDMPGRSGVDQRLFFHIKLDTTNGVYFSNPTIKWKVFRVT